MRGGVRRVCVCGGGGVTLVKIASRCYCQLPAKGTERDGGAEHHGGDP